MMSNWVWTDPAVGIVGSLVIASWAFGLIQASGAVLLDVNAYENLGSVVRERIETKGDRGPNFTFGKWAPVIARR
jgi:Co/Zn/Cd efflux system component